MKPFRKTNIPEKDPDYLEFLAECGCKTNGEENY